MSQTKNNVAPDVIVNANVNTINKLAYNIISTYIQYSKICTYLSVVQGSVSQDIWSIAWWYFSDSNAPTDSPLYMKQ